MQLTLTDADAGTLRDVLENYLTDLRMEIADTDSYDYRQRLKATEVFLKRLLGELGSELTRG